ncbi:transcriptional regulator [Hoyosella rhizosphaerae]|uniref:Transcriptional regulator n=1 Tax=Hoyosella rhizosphaerae TaxID=1755582 RepID=A0A916UK66_9ACTN|nr:helix-turn-helix domain-containing protein [Hoyosella rhizosphaerae]MBN4928301.1 transcriptional regulator [Hoyosella rhizosphaerae]GGC73923.1 transcriptional regulator [Hoyosella rhizosphaerae]
MTQVQPQLNRWLSVPPGADIARFASDAASAWESFLDKGITPASVRSVVGESWIRSKTRGVSPDAVEQTDLLPAADLEAYRSAHPMSLIRPVIRELLVADAVGSELLVAMSDEAGRLLWVDGDQRARDRAVSMSFVEGADWSEERVGTNAPGTALAVDHPIQIFGTEHFSRPVHEWNCSAAPVHDPLTGRIIGAIDITGGPRVAVPEMLQLVKATVRAAENELRLYLMRSPQPVTAAVPRLQTLGLTRPVLHDDSSSRKLSQRHAEILLLLAQHPEGLSSARLAVLLDESDLDDVTVRAEMSRLRKVIGAHVLGSRPYRLLSEVRTDVADVMAALQRGDIKVAIRSYTGPVLPESDAPGVVDLREDLHSRMQAALLRSGDPAMLNFWTSSVHGRDDLTSLEAYLHSLRPEDPMRSQVKARIMRLDRELRM